MTERKKNPQKVCYTTCVKYIPIYTRRLEKDLYYLNIGAPTGSEPG